MGEKFCATLSRTYNTFCQGSRWTDFVNARRILLLTFGKQIREITSENHCTKQWIKLSNRVDNILKCDMTSSALFITEFQRFYKTQEKNLNTIFAHFNCSTHCNSNGRSSDFLSEGLQFEFLSEHQRSPLRFVTFISLANTG